MGECRLPHRLICPNLSKIKLDLNIIINIIKIFFNIT